MTASTLSTRPVCPCCSERMSSDEEIVYLGGQAHHKDCADEHTAEIDELDALPGEEELSQDEPTEFEGMDVMADDNAQDFDF